MKAKTDTNDRIASMVVKYCDDASDPIVLRLDELLTRLEDAGVPGAIVMDSIAYSVCEQGWWHGVLDEPDVGNACIVELTALDVQEWNKYNKEA